MDRRTNGPCDQWFLFVVCLTTKSTRMRHRIVLAIVVDRVDGCGHIAIPDSIDALPGERGHALCLLAFRVNRYSTPGRGYRPGHCGEQVGRFATLYVISPVGYEIRRELANLLSDEVAFDLTYVGRESMASNPRGPPVGGPGKLLKWVLAGARHD
jgi:hypothetical protein